MDGDNRRAKIIKLLREAKKPLSGTELAGQLGVSRQVIVQDIALLRASDKNILSTNKGYILFTGKDGSGKVKQVFKVKHKDEEISDELYTIVDCGGRVLDVVVEHAIYGQIMVDLIINSRIDVDTFVRQVAENEAKPLNDLTKGIHYHTVEADSEERLELIHSKLKEKGYLIK